MIRGISISLVVLLMAGLVGCSTWPIKKSKAVQAFNRGNELRQAGLNLQAVEEYRIAISHKNNLYAASYNLALALVDLEQYEEALEILADLRARSKQNLKIIRTQGWVSHQAGDYQKALIYYNTALDIFEYDNQTLQFKVMTLEMLEEYKKAINVQELVIRLDDTVSNRLVLARLYLKDDQKEKALFEYKWVEASSKQSLENLLIAAEAAELFEEYTQAVDFLKSAAIEGSPVRDRALFRMGRLQILNLIDYKSGIDNLKAAFKAGFNDDKAIYNLLLEVPPDLIEPIKAILKEQGDEQEL